MGIHSSCLKDASRAHGVVFVDLDHNRIIPALEEDGRVVPLPKLPEREGAKLRIKLFEHGNVRLSPLQCPCGGSCPHVSPPFLLAFAL